MLGLQVELQPAVVGMAVVPGDELGRGVRASKILTGDLETPVRRCPDRIYDDVIVLEQLCTRDVGPQLHVAEEAEPIMLSRLGIALGHRFDPWVIRRDARAH